MNKRWLIRGASIAAVVGVSFAAEAQGAKPKPKPKQPAPPAATMADPSPTPPPATDAAAKPATEEEEGPYAPKGRTGKLKEETAEETPKSEGGKAPDRKAEKPIFIGLDAVIGFGKTVNFAAAPPTTTDNTVFSFVLGGTYRIAPTFGIGLRIPYSNGSVTEPVLNYSSTALGNIELSGVYLNDLGPSTRLPISLAIAVPLAQGDRYASPTDPGGHRQAAVNDAARSARGYEDDPLFVPHRLGMSPKVGLDYEEGGMRTGGYSKVDFLVKVGGNAPPTGDLSKQNSLAVNWVTGGQFFYEIVTDKVELGARAWLAFLLKDPEEFPVGDNASAPNKFQFVAEPALLGKFGAVRAGASYIFPISGRLGGDGSMSGVRILLGAGF